jgi:flagella synthesis protein FlgN
MRASDAAPERLHDLLNEAVRDALSLEAVLERETRALSLRDLEKLDDAVVTKHQIAQSLERITREQTALLQAEGFEPDRQGIEACLRVWDQEGLMRPLWGRLQDTMERCRRHNQINGGVVQTHQRQVQQALQILRGEDARTELYDPRGRTVASGPSRHISEA